MRVQFDRLFFSNENQSEHFKFLDGLRGIAVLIVILSHASYSNVFFNSHLNFYGAGSTGVFLFFVLSAYLLDRQIAIALMTGKSNVLYWKNYFLRRFLRIYPLFILALLLQVFLKLATINSANENLWYVLDHVFLIKGDGVFWSIAAEFKYYFISPLIMFICHKYLKWNIYYVITFLLAIILMAIILQFFFSIPQSSAIPFFPFFLIGTIISITELILGEKYSSKKNSFYIEFAGILSIVIILLTFPYYFESLFHRNEDFYHFIYSFPYAILLGCILVSSKYGTGGISKILSLKPLRFLGTISYSIYLFHMTFLSLVDSNDFYVPVPLRMYVFLFATILFSVVTYLFIEKPLSRIKLPINSNK